MKATKPLHLPETLPTAHAELVKLRNDLKARGAAARKAKDVAGAKTIRALARRVRRAERLARKGARKAAPQRRSS